MQILIRPETTRELVTELAGLSATRAAGALVAIAARSGIEAALRAYDAGMTTPAIAEPRQ